MQQLISTMYSQQLKTKERPYYLEQTPHFIFLDALQSYLKLEQNTSKNQKLIESLYDKLKAIPKFIIQFNFFQNSISYHSHQNYLFGKESPFSKLNHLGIYQLRILNTLDFDAFENFISLLSFSANKTPIKTHLYITDSWGVYFKKTSTLSFKSVLKKSTKEFNSLTLDINKNDSILSLLETLKTYPDSTHLRNDLETLLFNLIKNQRYHDALNLAETYSPKNYPLESQASLWSANLITKTLNHLKFFKVLEEHTEACENLLSTIPTEFFMLCFEHTVQFSLHPSKMIFIRYLARIHKGDSGFLQKILNLSPRKANTTIYRKSLQHLLYIMDTPINPNLIINISQSLNTSKKNSLIKLLLPHSASIEACTWLIENLETQSKAEQQTVIQQLHTVNQVFVAQLLVDKIVKSKQFKTMDPILKESIYDAVLANSPKLFTEYIQNHKLKKGLFYKSKNLDDYLCLEKVLKKNQFFSKSLTLRKVQKISKSFKVHILKKILTFLRLITHEEK